MPREISTAYHNADAAINLSKSANSLTDNIPNDVPEDLTSKKPDKANGLDGKKQAISIFIPQSIVEQHSSGQNLLIRPCAPNPFEHPYNQDNNHQAVPVDDLHSVDNDSEGAYLHSPEDINDLDMMHRTHGYDKDEAKQLEQLEIFAKEFKQRRIKMGFTQGDVGQAMGCLYGNDFSQTTISRFEALNLSFKNMIKLKPLLERWLMDANNVLRESKDGHSVVIPPQTNLDPHTMSRKRKKRTSIDAKKRTTLDRRFIMNPKPSSEELQSIAEECDMEKEVVRVWFCNRRQKEKRISMHEQQVHDVQELSSPDSPEHISAPTTSYSVPWKFTEAECEPSTSTVLRRPTPQNSNIELNPSATVKSFPHNRIKQESQKMATLPAVFGHGVLSNPNQTPILLSAAAAKSKGIQQAVSLHDHKLGPSPSGPNHLFQLNKMDSMAFNNRVQPNHGQSQSKTNNTSLPLPTTTVLNSLLNIGSTSFAMNNSHHTMPSMVNSCTNSNFTLDSKPGAAS